MKWTIPALFVLVLPIGLLAQSTGKTKAPAAASKQSAQPTDQEKNIRAYIELLRTDLRKQKTQIVSIVMQLDATDSAKFWPVYQAFEADYMKIGQGIIDLVKNYVDNYENLTPAVADQLASKMLDLEHDRNELKRNYYGKFKAALDPITAIRFLQVENQLERLVDLQIASELPVIEAPGSQQ